MTDEVNAAMEDLKEKSRAFTEATNGETSEEILAQMRGEEPASEDLNEIANSITNQYVGELHEEDYTDHSGHNLYWCAFKKGVAIGINWQKQQMMKYAIDGEVDFYEHGPIICTKPNDVQGIVDKLRLKQDDKVKLIIIKED